MLYVWNQNENVVAETQAPLENEFVLGLHQSKVVDVWAILVQPSLFKTQYLLCYDVVVVDFTVFYCLCIDILLLKDNETHSWQCESVSGRDSDQAVGSTSSKCCTQVVGCTISVKFDNAIGYVNIMLIYCFHWGFVCHILLLQILIA